MCEDPNAARDFVDLSRELKDAVKQLRELPLEADERARLTRKLLAITNVSKHDPAVAAKRLARLRAELQTFE
ncbi:hypothetical protein [Actinopolymorpha alba]|uniref:hypothetical protein n=1 Tax=Actinopolymorpha alba TaxID=533267 RepID=UPI00036F2AE6|nr:hypothetical protein [Actinopolymorpha alba]